MLSVPLNVVALALPVIIIAYAYQKKQLPLPPGPPSEGIAGNAKQLPRTEAWKTYKAWGEKYGPIVYFRILTRRVVVLNTAKAVADLLEKRSDVYSDRPKFWMYQELCNRKHNVFSISSENPRFKKYRKVLNSALNRRALKDYHDPMRVETRAFLQRLLSTPDNFINHIRRNAGAIVLKIAFGYTVSSDDDYFVNAAEKAFDAAAKAMAPGRWMVDYFPFLRFVPAWFPGADFQRQGKIMREELDKLTWIPHNWVKEQMATKNYFESFTSRQLQPDGPNGAMVNAEEEEHTIHIASALYAGAADTTVSALTTFFLVMSLYPDIQRRAQAEIDEKVGRNRLPDIEDEESLVYVKALMKEIFRWAPITPLGLPHAPTQDDEYEGYRIPRGTMVIPNIWAILHDETIYPDPFRFNPERFLKTDDHEPQTDTYDYEFGFGRRICPGMYFAHDSIFLTISRVLSTFDINKARDEVTGVEIEPEIGYSSGITSHAKPFKCRITPRSDAATLI